MTASSRVINPNARPSSGMLPPEVTAVLDAADDPTSSWVLDEIDPHSIEIAKFLSEELERHAPLAPGCRRLGRPDGLHAEHTAPPVFLHVTDD